MRPARLKRHWLYALRKKKLNGNKTQCETRPVEELFLDYHYRQDVSDVGTSAQAPYCRLCEPTSTPSLVPTPKE